ncbi:NAD(P)-dependent oxidoreductase [Flavobacteriaceae bacterium]|nr:NAD(P)-dependent oxidoreductase [Flavobacteriaceae bacterium]
MKVLITGSNGLLGSTLFEYLTLKGEIVERFNRNNFSWKSHKLNIDQFTDYDCIIHAAANTNVEACELDPQSCYKDNALLTERLAYAASEAKCKFIYISSTGIYGTEKISEPYNEYDTVNPTTHHHQSKWLGEQAVNKYIKNSLILRTGWIFGGNPDNPKNFVARRIEEALNSSSKQIQSNSQQIGVPTFVEDFAVKLYELLKNNEVGTFNIVNQGGSSRFEYVKKIIEVAALDVVVHPTNAGIFNRKAKVSNNESAIMLKIEQLGYDKLPFWQESLEKYINYNLSNWLEEKKN